MRLTVRRVALALLALNLLWGTAESAGSDPHAVISAITVEGNRRTEAADVTHRLTLKTGGAYDAAEANRSIKALFATGLFSDVRIARRGTRVVITVVENPVLAAITFSGNTAIESSALKPALTLRSGGPYTPAKADAGARAIRDLYRHKGRLTTVVTPSSKVRADGRVDLTYAIAESPVDRVARIVFAGIHGLTERTLRDAIASSETGWLDILTGAGVYAPEKLDLDRALILKAYRGHGYPDAKILAIEPVTGTDGTTLTYRIEEGDRFAFGPARIETALTGIDTTALDGLIPIAPSDTYDVTKVDSALDALSIALSRQGQPYARVSPRLDRDREAHRVAVTFVIDEGQHLTIERLAVTGNTRTKDHVIRRELVLAEGDAWNARAAERDRVRVEKLGFFKSVAWKTEPGSAPDRVSLSLEVVEQETAEIGFGIGLSSSEGVIGDINWSDKNLFGNGEEARIKLAGSLTRLEADIGFTEPHFLGLTASAGFDLFYKDTDASVQSSFKSQRAGGDLRLTTQLSDTLSTGLTYTFTRTTLYDVGPAASAAIREALGPVPGATSATYYTSAIGSTVTYDTRNSKKLPTSGLYLATASDFAGVGGDVQYIRQTGDARIYYPLSDQVTLVGRAVAGNIAGWGGQDVRLLDLFYKGGETVRGFAVAGLGPRDTLSANADALGGTTYIGTTAEARFALPLVPDDMKLRGAVFADAGSLFGANATAARLPGLAGAGASLRASVGTGLVWDSPVGPLRLDYAVPVAKQPFDKTQALSFGLAAY